MPTWFMWFLLVFILSMWLFSGITEFKSCDRTDHRVICVVFGVIPPIALICAILIYAVFGHYA
jgi:hypothetical protein